MSAGLIVAVLLAVPGTALAQASGPGNPLSPALPQNQSPAQTTTAPPVVPQTSTTSTAGDTGLSGGGVIAISIGALVILAGISLFIWRDARRRAPVRPRPAGPGGAEGSRSGSKARQKQRKLSPAERRRRKRGRAR